MGSEYKIELLNRRNVNLDLLKIICMAMVVMLHALSYGIEEAYISKFSVLHTLIVCIHSLCIVAVNCFVLISSYFLSQRQIAINKDSIKEHYKKIMSLWVQVVTYSIVIYVVLAFIGYGAEFSIKDLIKQALPILTNQYWFFTCYFLLYMLSPFLNLVLDKLKADEYRLILIILLVLFSVIPSLNVLGDSFGVKDGYSLTWFVCLYIVGGYVSKFGLQKRKSWLLLYIIATAVITVFTLCSSQFSGVLGGLFNLSSNTYNSPFVLFASVCLFMAALNAKTNWNHRIHTAGGVVQIANLSFGVYLLHEHSWFRDILWGDIVCLDLYCDTPVFFCLKLFFSVLIIFIFGTLTEFLRQIFLRLTPKISA